MIKNKFEPKLTGYTCGSERKRLNLNVLNASVTLLQLKFVNNFVCIFSSYWFVKISAAGDVCRFLILPRITKEEFFEWYYRTTTLRLFIGHFAFLNASCLLKGNTVVSRIHLWNYDKTPILLNDTELLVKTILSILLFKLIKIKHISYFSVKLRLDKSQKNLYIMCTFSRT